MSGRAWRVAVALHDFLRVIFDGAYLSRRQERELREELNDPYRLAGEREVDALLDRAGALVPPFTCPQCGNTSHNPNDARERYCSFCHRIVGQPLAELERPP